MTTVRLDPRLEATLRRLAEQRGQTKSEVMRDAIERLAATEVSAEGSGLERLRPYVGLVDSGGLQLSTETGRRFREQLLERKSRARRPSD